MAGVRPQASHLTPGIPLQKEFRASEMVFTINVRAIFDERSAMELFVTQDAVSLIKKRGGVAAIDFVPPIG
jgi:hypothetical protein